MHLTEEQIEKIVNIGFTYFRKDVGFPYENTSPIQLWYEYFKLKNKKSKIMRTSKGFFRSSTSEIDGTGTKIADHFHTHIFESHATGMSSAIDSFYDDVRLKKAIRLMLQQNMPVTDKSVQRMLKLVNGTQICTNFRPMAAKTIYHEYVQDGAGDILDPSTGYGGRMLGFLAKAFSKTKYVGADPSTKTHKANKKMASYFGQKNKIELHNIPFEDFEEQAGRFQLAFTSPPYFKKEIYSTENTQSSNKYQEYSDWIDHFWKPSIQKVRKSLKREGHFIINIQDIKIGTKQYPLVNDTKELMKQYGFELVEKIYMVFPGFGKSLEKRKNEPIMVFKKRKRKRRE